MGCQENIRHTVGGGIPVLPSSPAGGAEQPAPLQGGCSAAGADKAVAGAEGGQGQELVRARQDQVVGDYSNFGDDDFEGGGGDGNLQPGGGGS